jgi:hypothetical protein
VQHRLGCRDDDDEVGVDERRVDPQFGADLDLSLVLDVVDDQPPAEAAPELR